MRANYKVELASGIFLLLGIAAMIWLATKATNYGQEIGEDAYFISARFTNVADLKDRAPVKIGGVMVDSCGVELEGDQAAEGSAGSPAIRRSKYSVVKAIWLCGSSARLTTARKAAFSGRSLAYQPRCLRAMRTPCGSP